MSRYTQKSDYANIANYSALQAILADKKPTITVEAFPLSVGHCQDLLELMADEWVNDNEWQFYQFHACNDVMSGSSFVHDTRKGAARVTGSSQTVAHTVFNLGELGLTRNLVESQVPIGDCVQIQNKFFSYSRCQETVKALEKAFGCDWSMQVKLKEAEFSFSNTELRCCFTSKTANLHTVHFRIYGQGNAQALDGHQQNWVNDYKDGKYCNVYDHDYGRIRRGYRLDDTSFWQY